MRVLVTGGTGYLGTTIVRALQGRGHVPVVLARRASASALPGISIDGDVRDIAAVRGAAEGADAIIHSAALVSLWRPHAGEFDEVNVGGLLNVLDVARALGTPRVVYTSSFLALPPAGAREPLDANDYQRTKSAARQRAMEAAAAGTPLVVLCPGVVYGPGPQTEGNLVGRLLSDHLQGRLPGIVGADRCWSFAYVDDVAEAHVAVVERDRQPLAREYHIGGENAPQVRIFEIARSITGCRLPRRIPTAVARAAGAVEELRARITGRPPLVTRGAVEIFSHDWPLDSTRSTEDLNYRITPLEAGIRTTLASINLGPKDLRTQGPRDPGTH